MDSEIDKIIYVKRVTLPRIQKIQSEFLFFDFKIFKYRFLVILDYFRVFNYFVHTIKQ